MTGRELIEQLELQGNLDREVYIVDTTGNPSNIVDVSGYTKYSSIDQHFDESAISINIDY